MDHHPGTIETDAYRRLEATDLDWLTWDEKAEFFGELKGYGQGKGYKTGWAACKYKSRFLVWPDDKRVRDAPARDCSPLTLLWIKATMQDLWKQRKRPAR